MDYIIQCKQVGDTIKFKILRDSNILIKSIKIGKRKTLIPLHFEQKPQYLIVGGLVIMPVTLNYIKDKKYEVSTSWLNSFYSKLNEPNDEVDQLVFIKEKLSHKINSGYEFYKTSINKINGIKVKNFKHLINIIQNIDTEFIVFDLEHNQQIILNTKNIQEENNEILKQYNITHDRYVI